MEYISAVFNVSEANMDKMRKIDASIKAEVMKMLEEPGFSVAEISKTYEISRSTLHKWKQSKSIKSINDTERFVELSVLSPKRKLSKASLVFDDIAVSLEGKMSSSDLVSIIKILGTSC